MIATITVVALFAVGLYLLFKYPDDHSAAF